MFVGDVVEVGTCVVGSTVGVAVNVGVGETGVSRGEDVSVGTLSVNVGMVGVIVGGTGVGVMLGGISVAVSLGIMGDSVIVGSFVGFSVAEGVTLGRIGDTLGT